MIRIDFGKGRGHALIKTAEQRATLTAFAARIRDKSGVEKYRHEPLVPPNTCSDRGLIDIHATRHQQNAVTIATGIAKSNLSKNAVDPAARATKICTATSAEIRLARLSKRSVLSKQTLVSIDLGDALGPK
jgi:hypothetical protein